MIILYHDKAMPRLGRLYNDKLELIAYTLDPLILKPGKYKLELNYSPKFKCQLPLIYNDEFKPERGFRIHVGNTLADSQGCILVGLLYQIDLKNNLKVLDSKAALNRVLKCKLDELIII